MKGITLLMLSALSSVAYAGCASDYCQNVYVEEIEVQKNGNLIFSTSGVESRMYCDPINGDGILVQKNGNEAYNEMYSLLVSSQKSETPITARIDGDEYDCILERITSK